MWWLSATADAPFGHGPAQRGFRRGRSCCGLRSRERTSGFVPQYIDRSATIGTSDTMRVETRRRAAADRLPVDLTVSRLCAGTTFGTVIDRAVREDVLQRDVRRDRLRIAEQNERVEERARRAFGVEPVPGRLGDAGRRMPAAPDRVGRCRNTSSARPRSAASRRRRCRSRRPRARGSPSPRACTRRARRWSPPDTNGACISRRNVTVTSAGVRPDSPAARTS